MHTSTGIITKAHGSFYYVLVNHETVCCQLRGKVKNAQLEPLVGDRVEIDSENQIEKVLPRKNSLRRPRVTNVDQSILVFAFKKPDLLIELLDRFILLSDIADVKPLICLNKKDLLPTGKENAEYIQELKETYAKAGYPVYITSTQTKEGIEELRAAMKDKLSVLAGPSGGGKTSLINCLEPELALDTGILSPGIERGRHTTRTAVLLTLGKDKDVLVADTPGFTALDLTHIYFWRLQDFFPDFGEWLQKCKFSSDCMHESEPGCKIREAVEKGQIAKSRYLSYICFLKEIKEKRRFRYQYRMEEA